MKRIIDDPEIIEGLTKILKEFIDRFKPLSIIITGSIAEKKFVRGLSDIDILIIVDEVKDRERFHLRAVNETNIEITVIGFRELVQAIKRGNQFYRKCLKGVEIYGDILEILKHLT